MNKKQIILTIGILIIGIMAVTSVSAFTDNYKHTISVNFFSEVQNSECSSIILQVNDNESVSSFRRDENNPAEIFIDKGKWDNISYIKQYKKSDGEFFQALITENGYIIGVGGGTDGYYNKEIEEIASKMVLSGNSSKYISEIQDILGGYEKGHFIIKAPDGSYDVVWPTGSHHGKLNQGQYICVPNMEKYSFSGNFSSNPVDEAIKIAGTDSFGINRRDIIIYDYINNEFGTFVRVYASNDDGSMVGSNNIHFKDDINYMGDLYSADDLPNIPNKINLGVHTFNLKLWNFSNGFQYNS